MMHHGILLLDKPTGFSSNQVLVKVKKALRVRKAGHTGSLDPLASGMLPICLGEATKFARFFLEADKAYIATAQFGVTTTTGDKEGEIIHQMPADLSVDAILAKLPAFIGKISQIPPMYSAVKVNGKALYKLARKGIEVDRQARELHIHRFELLEFDAATQIGQFAVVCSKGTYIRTLLEDFGHALGTGAHLAGLRRTWVAPFTQQSMVPLDRVREASSAIFSIKEALSHLPEITLCEQSSFRIGRGEILPFNGEKVSQSIVLNNQDGEFIGVGRLNSDGKLAPTRLMQSARIPA